MSPTKTLLTAEDLAQLPSAETEDFELVEVYLVSRWELC